MPNEMDFPTNPEKLPWPQDIGGITAKLRREGCRSIGRINGNDKQYETVLSVLRVLARHAKVKLAAQKKRNIDRKVQGAQQQLDRINASEGDRVLQMRNIAKDMEHMQAQYQRLVEQGITPSPVHTVANITPPSPPAVPVPPKSPLLPHLTVKERKLQSEQAKAAGLGLPKAG